MTVYPPGAMDAGTGDCPSSSEPSPARIRLESQTVYLAVYGKEWGEGGNPSGNWQHEVVSREQIGEQGWIHVGFLAVKHSDPQYQEEPAWILFARACKSGESFVMRTHKYQAPVLIWGTAAGAEQSR